MEEVQIEKMVHGGQGLGTLSTGQKIFVWNALPGETVKARIIKKKKSYLEAIAEEIIESSPERIEPQEENYLATSPWQMMAFEAENKYKREIVAELFAHEKVALPEYGDVLHDDRQWHYRNKMEYSFWGDDDGLHLALYRRGTHGKHIVTGSKLALPVIDNAANSMLAELQKLDIRAGDLKTIIIRCTQEGEAAASLFVKPEKFPKVDLPQELKGLRIYHSNPKSPASVPTKLLYELGNVLLYDTLLDKKFVYNVDSFFQVNIPMFEKALSSIKAHGTGESVTDMYAGTGSIGLSVAEKNVDLIELDPDSAKMAGENAQASSLDATVIEASTEKVLEYITGDKLVVFDPPRAGLHTKVVEQVLEVLPPKVIYLSCNPATQARDLERLQKKYTIDYFEIYNFFPRTPHIETLAVLRRK
jgi:23S rRNA (uracil1939-C5)-methyltransferase